MIPHMRSGKVKALAVTSPEMRDFALKESADAVGSTPQEFAAYFKSEVERYAAVIRVGNIRVE